MGHASLQNPIDIFDSNPGDVGGVSRIGKYFGFGGVLEDEKRGEACRERRQIQGRYDVEEFSLECVNYCRNVSRENVTFIRMIYLYRINIYVLLNREPRGNVIILFFK